MRKVPLLLLAAAALAVPDLRAGELIRAAQLKLAAMGYYKGTIDGAAGSMTAAAVRRFQVAQKLRVTGELTPETVKALGLHTGK
jgi:peptidoglycan hydrolase-like protein with peptidoglycan-binding domain